VRGSSSLFHHNSRVAGDAVRSSAELVGVCLLAIDSGNDGTLSASSAISCCWNKDTRRHAIISRMWKAAGGRWRRAGRCTYLSRVPAPVPPSHPPSPPIPPPGTPGRYDGTCEGLYRYRGLRPTGVWMSWVPALVIAFIHRGSSNPSHAPGPLHSAPRQFPLYMNIASSPPHLPLLPVSKPHPTRRDSNTIIDPRSTTAESQAFIRPPRTTTVVGTQNTPTSTTWFQKGASSTTCWNIRQEE
jgi:hypothetical protein